MKNTALPVLSLGPVRNRQAPRAPSPASGVTSSGRMSSILLAGVTRPSSLLRTHAPVPTPRTASVCKPCAARLCRLQSAPAGVSTFPTLSLQSVLRRLDPYPATFPRCTHPLFPRGHRPHVRVNTFGTPEDLCKATLAEGVFRGCSHSLMFRLPNSLGPQVAPTARPLCVLGGRAVYATPNPASYLTRAVASLRA
jgi:hypothetical protein